LGSLAFSHVATLLAEAAGLEKPWAVGITMAFRRFLAAFARRVARRITGGFAGLAIVGRLSTTVAHLGVMSPLPMFTAGHTGYHDQS
jgi:hypothetical protein